MKSFWRILDTTTKKGVQKWRHFFSSRECLSSLALTVRYVRKLKKWKFEILIAIMKENMFWWRKIMWNFFLSFFRKYLGKIFLKNIFLRPIHYENMTISDKILHMWGLEGYRKNIKKYQNIWERLQQIHTKSQFLFFKNRKSRFFVIFCHIKKWYRPYKVIGTNGIRITWGEFFLHTLVARERGVGQISTWGYGSHSPRAMVWPKGAIALGMCKQTQKRMWQKNRNLTKETIEMWQTKIKTSENVIFKRVNKSLTQNALFFFLYIAPAATRGYDLWTKKSMELRRFLGIPVRFGVAGGKKPQMRVWCEKKTKV